MQCEQRVSRTAVVLAYQLLLPQERPYAAYNLLHLIDFGAKVASKLKSTGTQLTPCLPCIYLSSSLQRPRRTELCC